MIRTPDQRLRVFVSSTLGELAEERAAVRGAIEQVRLVPVMFELGAHAHPPRALYRAYLEQSHVFVGVYWQSYGWVAPDMEVSGIEDEYDLSAGKPALVYIKAPAPEREQRMQQFIRRLQGEDRVSYKRFQTPEELAALVADDLALLLTERFEESRPRPAGAMAPGPAARAIPVPPTSLVGRESELEGICELLAREDVRLVTLSGVGGIGKTRLALEATRRSAHAFPDGVFYADLSPVTEPELVPTVVAASVGIPSEGTRPATEAIIDRLAPARALLLLDNFEQVLDAAPFVIELLAGCPEMTALVTSRALLRVRGEHEFPVMPLRTPAHEEALEPGALASSPAVQLFVERAEEIDPRFALDGGNGGDVAELCRRLDGIPLALELAAARVQILPPHALLTRIGDRLDLLSGAVDLPERQRTLRATLDWSHELLDKEERALFARLSVFVGGFTLDAAHAVCVPDGLPDALEQLASLIAKSMVVSQPVPGGEPRFRMLETVREYAGERLRSRGETDLTERRMAEYYVRFARRAARGLVSAEHAMWMETLDAEVDNIRAADFGAIARGEFATALRIGVTLWIYWWIRGLVAERRTWVEAILAKNEPLDPELRAMLLFGVGACRLICGDDEAAIAPLRELVDLQRERGDEYGLALAEALLGNVLPYESVADEVHALLTDATETLRRIGDPYARAWALTHLGEAALRGGDVDKAEMVHHELLENARAARSDQMIAQAFTMLGLDALTRGEVALARERFAQSAGIHRHIRSLEGLAYTLDGLAGVALMQGNPQAAAVALGSSRAIRDRIGIKQVWPLLRPTTQALNDAVRTTLGDQRFEAARQEGAKLRSEEAIDRALAATKQPSPTTAAA